MKRLFIYALVASSIVFHPGLACAESDTPKDKSGYTLFCPTPDSEMREWHTDILAASPYTVDPGHFEIQFDAVSYAMGSGTIRVIMPPIVESLRSDVDEWTYGAFVAKAGLLNNLDVEVGFVPYRTVTYKSVPIIGLNIGRTTRSGSGDTDATLKWNLWGNDGGKTALSLSGTVVFPTGTHDFSDDIYAGGPMLESRRNCRGNS